MKPYYFKTENGSERKCPSCDKWLNYIHYLSTNVPYKMPKGRFSINIRKRNVKFLRFKKKDFKKLWNNPDVALLCCECIRLFEKAEYLKRLDEKDLQKMGFCGEKIDLLEEYWVDELYISEIFVEEMPTELLKEFDLI